MNEIISERDNEIWVKCKIYYIRTWADQGNPVSLVAQMVKNLPTMQETQVRSLDQADPLKKGKATHSTILTWRIPWTEEPGGLQSMWLQRVRHNWATHTHTLSKVYGIMFWLSCNMAWSLQSIISYRHTHTHKLFSWWELLGLTLLTTFIHTI